MSDTDRKQYARDVREAVDRVNELIAVGARMGVILKLSVSQFQSLEAGQRDILLAHGKTTVVNTARREP